MGFKEFKKLFQQNFAEMVKDADHLYEVGVDKDELWNLYLNSFPSGTNDVYRKRREHDCGCCRHFIKTIGNAVVIKNNKIQTMWDFDVESATFKPVINALAAYLKSKPVSDVYITKDSSIGTDSSHESSEDGIITYEHFYLKLPPKFVTKGSRSVNDVKGSFRDTRNVFKRSLDEITEDSVNTLLELISQNSLYRGEEWKTSLQKFLKYKKEYAKLKTDSEKENYCWVESIKAGAVVGRIRNSSIGALLVNISEGVELDTAVKKYEAIVAPANYKRPKAIFTQKMLDDAKKAITELGYMDSLSRRHATLDDISVNDILFSNRDAAKRIDGADVFGALARETKGSAQKFSKVEEISINKFISDILPTTSELEAYLDNRHTGNMVSLIAPAVKESKSMFKWDNGFSWAYAGNVTDSMKERVKAAGGKVDGVLRFSIQWNDIDKDTSDLDAHCIEPSGSEIYYVHRIDNKTCGNLDIDITNPLRNVPAVENITWPTLSKMDEGKYRFFVYGYSIRKHKSGFRAEIEYNGETYSFDYNKPVRQNEKVQVAEVTLKNGQFTIVEKLPSNVSSREVWGLKTNQFVPVSVMMYSPNYWAESRGVGLRHYFFMLKGCVNPEEPNSFYNEFLKEDLLQHKRVFEALGNKTAVGKVDDQLSGLGFAATKHDELVVKVKGSVERVLKIKF